MEKSKTDKAVAYAYRLCTIRPRSEEELRKRLFKKGFGRATVCSTLFMLKEKNIVDDVKFARLWVESRMRKNPKGDALLRKELYDKGISTPIIEEVLSGKEEKEDSIVRSLAKGRLPQLKKLPKEKAKKRLFDYLARRGFKFDIINDVINEEIC